MFRASAFTLIKFPKLAPKSHTLGKDFSNKSFFLKKRQSNKKTYFHRQTNDLLMHDDQLGWFLNVLLHKL